ncbi:helix-turn-helix domain-containing protein [Mitsuokella jalaludinii]|uniref:helix-turn-helix domain-containing protein n=1 Tax=Mitsuokella jalaludinii TaxID=187979 RepID=UPI003D018716
MGDLPSIQQLECFIIYGRVQNFTRAAKEANITQSAFSAQMKNLESVLGVTLIQRSKRGSHLTEGGRSSLRASRTGWMACTRSSTTCSRPMPRSPLSSMSASCGRSATYR